MKDSGMAHDRLTDDILEQAASYALGLLEPAEAQAFERHLQDGCAICEAEVRSFRETAALLPSALPQSTPSPRVREQLLERIENEAGEHGPQVWREWVATPLGGIHVVRASEGEWQPVGIEGVWVKRLYADPARDTVTMLVRMAPGTAYPSHRHAGAEQCLVLEGDLETGDIRTQAGDYQCAPRESVHAVSRTKNGCLLLIVSSRHDELV
jgi:anti-sigma factor ChrR (cupin superfamily)